MWRTIDFHARIALAYTWFFIASLISLALVPFRWKDPSLGGVFARIISSVSLPILGYRTDLRNQSRLYVNQPCIYVANHQSNLDIFTLAPAFPYRTVVIGKRELKWVPLFGLLFVGAGNIMINRKNRANSIAGLDAAAREIKERGLSVWIFPEGTRNRGAAQMLPFKKGAFYLAIKAQVPIVPIVHQHLFSYCEADKCRLHRGKITTRVLEPIPTRGLANDDVPQLMAEVRLRMERALVSPDLKHRSHS